MVAGFQDDVDPEDQPCSRPPLPSGPVPSKDVSLSSEEEVTSHPSTPSTAALASQQCSELETKWYGQGPQAQREGQAGQPRSQSVLVTKVFHQGHAAAEKDGTHTSCGTPPAKLGVWAAYQHPAPDGGCLEKTCRGEGGAGLVIGE